MMQSFTWQHPRRKVVERKLGPSVLPEVSADGIPVTGTLQPPVG
jgi:hypothetical protein